MMGMAAAVLLSSCVKDTLYDTPHPDYGKIAVTADWSARGEGIDMPATWTVTMGDYTGTETSDTHAPEDVYKRQVYSFTASPVLSATEVTPCQSPSTVARVDGAACGVASTDSPVCLLYTSFPTPPFWLAKAINNGSFFIRFLYIIR